MKGAVKPQEVRRGANSGAPRHSNSGRQQAKQPALESSGGEIDDDTAVSVMRAYEEDTAINIKRSYEVEEVVSDAIIEGRQHFEIQWRGFSIEHNTWLTKDDMEVQHPQALAKYLKALGKSKADISKFYRLLRDAKGPPISIVNTVDEVGCPENFTYINQNIYSDEVPRPCTPMFWCECTNGCRDSCECTKERNYDNRGLLLSVGNERIVECGPLCKCGDNCVNRVVQKGSKVVLELRRYPYKGWGVVTKNRLKKGTFVAEYVGEVITSDEAESRGFKDKPQGETYLFDLDQEFVNDACDFSIDAKTHGNISRFFNHSCSPNMNTRSIYIEHRDPRLHRLAIFTTRDVKAGEELTIDYSPAAVEGESVKGDPCHCGSSKCRKFMYF
ncbi:hypothetical protein IWW37_004013 [Coemansia sp. RSA 2050]|nr:hypothetical protein IWW37_004013 [Coemansia sp. RSA 2050]KAJ2733744.1 hypothetical protein IW152_002849 [Coemansia sp. BCRC 34962]